MCRRKNCWKKMNGLNVGSRSWRIRGRLLPSRETVKRDEMIGTLTVGDESHPVYLAKMEAHQCGREHERYLGKPVIAPGRIIRKFVLIEA